MQTIEEQRSLVLSTRIRFSPQIQPVRDTAIDKIVEQNLLLAEVPLTLNEILGQALASRDGIPLLTGRDLKDSLARLLANGRVIPIESDDEGGRYALSDVTRIPLWQVQREAENRFVRVTERLFKHAPGGRDLYSETFLKSLCNIFSRLGEAYVRVLKGDNRISDFVGPNTITEVLDDLIPASDRRLKLEMRTALLRFFEENDPDYAAIKWNLAQNYYIAKALGLDPSGGLLSRDVFTGAIFYLDTNVIIPALEPKAKDHLSAKMLLAACAQIGVEVRACQISVEQLRNVTQYHADVLPRIVAQIPQATGHKIRNLFYTLYCETAESGDFDPDTLFQRFYQPAKYFPEIGIDLCDDHWFDDLEQNAEVRTAAAALNTALETRHRRPKRDRSARHDAALVCWVKKERANGADNAWLVTLDSSLADTSWVGGPGKPIAITLDALLQWIAPVTASINGDFEDSYAEAIRNLLLPQENIFDLRDFLIFAEIDWSCKELPAKDVEDCIRSIKAELPMVDPTTPEGRETLAHHISKFFADPGREFKQEIVRLEQQKKEDDVARDELLADAERAKWTALAEKDLQIADRERIISRLQEQIEAHKQTAQEDIGRLAAELEAERQARVLGELRRSAWLRLAVCLLMGILIEMIAVYSYIRFGEGNHWIKRITTGWQVLISLLAIPLLLSWFLLGPARLRTLGWPFTKLLKAADEGISGHPSDAYANGRGGQA